MQSDGIYQCPAPTSGQQLSLTNELYSYIHHASSFCGGNEMQFAHHVTSFVLSPLLAVNTS